MSKMQLRPVTVFLVAMLSGGILRAQTKATSPAANPQTSDAIQHVSGSGKNSNDGFSWGTAKASLEAARSALPPTGGDILFAPILTAKPPAYTSFNSMQLKNFTNLNGTTFTTTPRGTGQWFLNKELRTLSGNPTISGATTLYHYPMIVSKTIDMTTSSTVGDLSNLQALQTGVFMLHDFAPSFAGTLYGVEIDDDLEASTTIDKIRGLAIYVGPYSNDGNPADLSANTKDISDGITSTCENNGIGTLNVCRAFVGSAFQNGTSATHWGGFWDYVGYSPNAGKGETFTGNNYNFVSYAPVSLPKFSATTYHDFGMVFTTNSASRDPYTNDLWFWGGGWNSGHFLFGSSAGSADHVWWAGGKYGWVTKEGGPPTSSTDFTYSTAMIDSRTNTLVMPRGRVGDPAITAEGPLTLDPKQLNLSPRDHGIVITDNSHLQQSSANGDLAGRITITSGVGHHTFAHAFTNPPICIATDTTATNAVRVTTSATSLSVSGPSGDVVNYICIGNPN